MNKDKLKKVLAPVKPTNRCCSVVLRPSVKFFDGETEVHWLHEVDEIKVWMCKVHGRAWVSKRGTVISARSRPLFSDTNIKYDPFTSAQLVSLPVGTMVQAGISVVRRNGFRTVTAAVGIVPEHDKASVMPWMQGVAEKVSDSKSPRATVQIEGVIQLTAQDARLISCYRQDIKDHGEAHVRAIVDLVANE